MTKSSRGLPASTSTKFTQMETHHERHQNSPLKNESGDHVAVSGVVDRDAARDLGQLETHLTRAELHFDNGDMERGADELIAAAARLRKHHGLVQASIGQAIARLSTLDGHAAPPHPKALELVRMRKTLPV